MVFCKYVLAAVALGVVGQAAGAAVCDDFYARLPNVKMALCQQAQLQATAGRSVKGRTLYTTDIRPPDAKLRVLVVGGIHGDELSSASVALHWIALARSAPAQTHWRFVPVLNPDGMLGRPARRVNANGVDLNRNFPTPGWEKESVVYWQQRTQRDPRRWPGKTALSEPESRFLVQTMDSFKPHLIVSIHAPYGVLDFDGPVMPPTRLGRLYLDQVGVFPGSLGNYGGIHKRMPVVTIELPNALKTPPAAEIKRMWTDLQRWMDETIKPGLTAQGQPSPAG